MHGEAANQLYALQAPGRFWELSSDLMGVTDRQGRLLAANSAWSAALGWTHEQLLGEERPSIVHPEDIGSVAAELARVSSGTETLKFESRLRRSDGEYRQFSWRAFAEGDRVYVVGRDITERMQQEETARHAQKMEAIGQLTGGIAHDFNNLLTIVRSSIELLKKPGLPEARRQRYVQAIDEAVERATKVTQQLLSFARRQRLEPEVFDVAERIGDVSELLRRIVGAGVRVETAADPGICVEADLSQFETALMNLAVNARDAMEGEGQVTIEARPVEEIPSIRGHGPSGGAFVAVSVRDTGCGIAPDQMSRIFEPFFTTKETGKGTGLGLSQVYGFVKQSGGSIEARSAPGEGAEFTIYLPRTGLRPQPRDLSEAAEEPPAPANLRRRALVVEDNEEVGRFCIGLMQDLGYAPSWARNAREALEALADGADYDLVFSDVVMPGMSGIELAEQIQQTRPGLPILLTSGYSAILAEEGRRGFRLLPKPYSATELQEALSAISAG